MQEENSSKNKRLAKNTVYLYIRLAITLLISLYTSRVLLNALGITDFGIYNVVGGVVVLFSFITAPMISTTQRYITVALGKGSNEYLNGICSYSIKIHAQLSLAVFVLAESIGLWLLSEKLVIAEDRYFAAHIVYQISIITSILNLIMQPFYSIVIAYERMSFYALVSVLEAILKLLVVVMLSHCTSLDRLILYSSLLLAIQMISFSAYVLYVKLGIGTIHFRAKTKDDGLRQEMFKFAGWNLFGGLSYVAVTQGVNILLNIFFGPTINAARGLAVQVQSATKNFAESFQNAINPQITKSYSTNDMDRTFFLINNSARFSLLLLSLVALPIGVDVENVLNIWLLNPPEHTANFVRITIFMTFVNVIGTPLTICSLATGEIKRMQIATGIVSLSVIPVSYVALKLGAESEIVFLILAASEVLSMLTKLILLNWQIKLSVISLCKGIFPPICIIVVSAIALRYMTGFLSAGIIRIIILFICNVVLVSAGACLLCLSSKERKMIYSKIRTKIIHK